ncbi:MAG TPA: beta-ketoacyl synthase N-terminal-like domain-containing protein [Sideroxyarcus sp.]|nr:beta-ketoacyl synthase N-terminal-like domain-containing protein [Sideroxyarcus sp.]
MNPIHLAGRGLACSLGLSVEQALATLQQGRAHATQVSLPGAMAGDYPFHAIPFSQPDWNERACTLVQRVVAEAGAQHIRNGVLLIATSSFDIGAVERGATRMDYQAFADKVAAWLDWCGPVHVVNTACTSSLNALLFAQALLRSGAATDALVLGIELYNRLTLGGFAALQLLSRTGSRPFGAERDGLVLGEAVAALHLSVREASGWQLLGGASVVDGEQPTGASPVAVCEMYRQALADSGVVTEAIDLVKVQAAGSPGNDAVEAQGLRSTFDSMPPLVSLKATMGHTMGASGAAEIALLTACLEQGAWPGGENAADQELGVTLAAAMPSDVRRFMATILGFGGSHASVVLERT